MVSASDAGGFHTMYAARAFGPEVETSFAARSPGLETRERIPGRLVFMKIGSEVGFEVVL